MNGASARHRFNSIEMGTRFQRSKPLSRPIRNLGWTRKQQRLARARTSTVGPIRGGGRGAKGPPWLIPHRAARLIRSCHRQRPSQASGWPNARLRAVRITFAKSASVAAFSPSTVPDSVRRFSEIGVLDFICAERSNATLPIMNPWWNGNEKGDCRWR